MSLFENSLKRQIYVLAQVKDSDACKKYRNQLYALNKIICEEFPYHIWCLSCGYFGPGDGDVIVDTCDGCDWDVCTFECIFERCGHCQIAFHKECKSKTKCKCEL